MIAEPSAAARAHNTWIVCAVLFVAALVPRLLALWITRPSFAGIHWELSENILRHAQLGLEGTPRTDYEPLYPLFIAAVRWLGGREIAVQAMQAAVAASGAVAMHTLTVGLTESRRVAILAAVLYAVYPLLIRHSIDLSDTALTTTGLIAFAYAFTSTGTASRAALAGLCLGLLVLTRAMTLPLVAIGFAVLAWKDRPAVALAFAATALIVVSPSMIRNYALNGALLPTRGGWNLFIGNCAYVVLPEYGPDVLNDYASAVLVRDGLPSIPESPSEERAADRVLRQHALRYIGQHPLQSATARLRHIGYMFTPRLVPYHQPADDTQVRLIDDGTVVVENSPLRPRWHQAVYGVSYTMVMAAAVVGAWKRRALLFNRDLVLWAIVGTFVVVHAVFFPATRYLAPVSFVWLFYAAAAFPASTRHGDHARATR